MGAVALSLVALLTACQSTPTRTAAELKNLQGYWQGSGASITIAGNSLHYYSGTNEWFQTTSTLPAGTDPRQLLATIKDCATCKTNSTTNSSLGHVVGAIFKIEDGTLTLAVSGEGEAVPPKSFEAENIGTFKLHKGQPPKKNTEPPKTK